MIRSLVLLVLTTCLVATLTVVAQASAGESGGIRPTAYSIRR